MSLNPSPYVLSRLPTPDKTICAVCKQQAAPGETLKRCQKCRSVPYCSRECQVADWKKHKQICFVYMRDRSLNTTSMNFGEKGSKKGGRTRADVLQDLSVWAQEHNGDTLTFACWQAMDLTIDIHKADTHFLALTLRKNDVWTNRRAMYKLVDAQVLPLTLLSKKFEHAADALDEQPVDVVQQVLGTDKRRRIADGALGSVLVMSFELGADETMTVEEAVLKKVTPTFQPLGLFKEHYEYLRRLPPVVGSFWKPCLRNALDGGAYSIKFEPWPAT